MRNSMPFISTGCARYRRRVCSANKSFSAMRRLTNDEVYWLETVMTDGTVTMALAEGDRERQRKEFRSR